MNLVISRLGIYHAINSVQLETTRERESDKEALISNQEGEKYRPTSDRSHSDMTHMNISSFASLIIAVSTARLLETSVND
jgi:hypothetical protein